MLEHGKRQRVVACAFDWPGWDRSARTGQDVVAVLEGYRARYATVAELAGYGAEFAASRGVAVVEQVPGIGMTDFYGVSGRPATPEYDPMTDAECERKIALLRASWSAPSTRTPPASRASCARALVAAAATARTSSGTSTGPRSTSSLARSASRSPWRPGTIS